MPDRFIQLHLLTFYGPANLNRDDTGRPKTALIGGVERLRVSSQSLKRAVRTSDTFQQTLHGHLAARTQRLGEQIESHLVGKQVAPDAAASASRKVAEQFGKLKGENDDNPTRIEQLAFVSPEEQEHAFALAERIAKGEEIDFKKEGLLRKVDGAADIAMFGRMLADNPVFNRDAAVQVAHAFSTHNATPESDFYTAVDDLKSSSEDAGAGFIGSTGFGSAVFYLYACINRALLIENLGGNDALANSAISALTHALATVSPTGKQASFASRARADYIMAERGDDQPRNLAGAFVRPVSGKDLMENSIAALEGYRDKLTKAYADNNPAPAIMNVRTGAGTLADIINHVSA
ncbi:MAG: type I-E CRISPR-associated protein Cas7/Cse4/CasC [Hyphomicrobiaceae bacterium]|nr:type I-E CRISPR-associated protein Cas7/Cse4/CasC [Hyphomicrobiaceae bacterium]